MSSYHKHEWYEYVVQSGRPMPCRRCEHCGIIEWLWNTLDGDNQWHRAPAFSHRPPTAKQMTDERKPLKPYRSEAERIAVKQRNIQIAMTTLSVTLSLIILLHVFRLI